MFGYYDDIDRTFQLFDTFRQELGRALEPGAATAGAAFPATNLYDAGHALVLTAEVPGLQDKDLQITLNQDVLTVAGQRKAEVPEGYSVHRQERAPFRFSRSYQLPVKVDPEKTSARLDGGVLEITLEKAPEVKPRQIVVRPK